MTMSIFFFFNDTATTEIYTLSLHDALPIWMSSRGAPDVRAPWRSVIFHEKDRLLRRSEEHTSELQSRPHLVCRLLLEKKKKRDDREVILVTHDSRVFDFDYLIVHKDAGPIV